MNTQLRILFMSALLCAIVLVPSLAESQLTESDLEQYLKPISDDEYTHLQELLIPEQKPWMTIPWQTSLLEAQNIAASESKPVFIWAMDGHPLGCT